MTARLSPRRAAARERDVRVKRAEVLVLTKARAFAEHVEAWHRKGVAPSDEALVGMMTAARALRIADLGEESPVPTLSETIFECWGCQRSCRGRNDGAFFEQAWSRIRGIDGPDALCPTCTADPATYALLAAAGYPDARILPGHCIACSEFASR